jgi:hypothetical protein
MTPAPVVQPFTGGATAHLPGWSTTTGACDFQLWAPRPADYPYPGNRARTTWKASWNDESGARGNFEAGDTAEAAMQAAGFPGDVQAAFIAALPKEV